MKKKYVTGVAALLICLGCASSRASQVSPLCPHIQFCLFDQEAAVNDPAGIHKYSRDLVDLVLPNQMIYGRSPSGRMEEFEHELLGEDYAADLADRLARAEQTARTGNGRLVPEASVVKAFNDLMQGIAAPPSMRADIAAIHSFREHAASLKAFPALLSADRNGTNCNPGEAVFLLYLLLSNNSQLSERTLDEAVTLMQEVGQGTGRSQARMSTKLVQSVGTGAEGLLSSYSLRHRHAAESLFKHVAQTLGFR